MRLAPNLASDPQDMDGGGNHRRGWPEIILGLVTLPFVVGLYIETLSFRKNDWEPLGMAFWPQAILICIGVSALWFIFTGLRKSSDAEPVKVSAIAPWLAVAAFLMLIYWVGTYISGFLLIAGLTWYLRPGPPLRSAGVAVVNAVVSLLLIHLIFIVILGMRMPTGQFGF
jgi:hypothetical protein